MLTREIVVVGASTGGLEALSELVSGLAPDFPAALFIVRHTAAGHISHLPDILSSRGPLRATHAVHGEPISHGRIYVAPPDNHLIVRRGYVHVVRGPKENNHRPSVDVLFRSAAAAYGGQVIGVVLSGHLDCGTAGCMSIKARGGVTIAQKPEDAQAPSMPSSAIRHTEVDHIAPSAEIARLLTALVREPIQPTNGKPSRRIMELEGDEPGTASDIVCPTCQGQMTEATVSDFVTLRCHVGHSFTLDSAADAQTEEIERALWAASRALEEGARFSQRMAASSSGQLRTNYEEKHELQTQQAQLIRQLVLDGTHLR